MDEPHPPELTARRLDRGPLDLTRRLARGREMHQRIAFQVIACRLDHFRLRFRHRRRLPPPPGAGSSRSDRGQDPGEGGVAEPSGRHDFGEIVERRPA
jgi:hypothetical protein